MTLYRCIKYADDLTVLCWSSSIEETQVTTQRELTNISNWCDTKEMKFNTNKTKVMLISPKKEQPHINLSINNLQIGITKEAKLLGVWLQNDLKWNLHVNYIISKASSRIFNLILLKRAKCSPEICSKFYQYMIRSHLTYCYPTFCNATQHLKKNIEKFERRCFRIIGCEAPSENVLTVCDKQCQTLAKSIMNDTYHPIRCLLTPTNGRTTRSNRTLTMPAGSSTLYVNSFFKYFI